MNDERSHDAPSALRPDEGRTGEAAAPKLRLRSLKVHAFRDVRPGTELHFGSGFHLVLGKNGAGKSTLLELLAAVSTLDFGGAFFAETPFHVEASFEVGNIALHAEMRRTFEIQRVKSVGDRYIELPPRDEAEAILRVEQLNEPFSRWMVARTGEEARVSPTDPRRAEEAKSSSYTSMKLDPLRLSVALALALGASAEGDESYAFLSDDVAKAWLHVSLHPGTGAPFDEALGALHLMVGKGLTVVRAGDVGPPSPWLPPSLDFKAQGEPVERDLSEHPLLKAAAACLGYDGAKLYFGPGASGKFGWTYSAPSFQFFREGNAVRRHDQLSFGQQRLFSFAWYLACNPDLAIADELVNGLHSEWIDWCIEAIGDRQCFLTSQNPLLVDAVPLGSEEDIRRGIILCEASRASGELSWRQLDDRESELIARALGQSRLDLLSDLLHALDLW